MRPTISTYWWDYESLNIITGLISPRTCQPCNISLIIEANRLKDLGPDYPAKQPWIVSQFLRISFFKTIHSTFSQKQTTAKTAPFK